MKLGCRYEISKEYEYRRGFAIGKLLSERAESGFIEFEIEPGGSNRLMEDLSANPPFGGVTQFHRRGLSFKKLHVHGSEG